MQEKKERRFRFIMKTEQSVSTHERQHLGNFSKIKIPTHALTGFPVPHKGTELRLERNESVK